ncbi:MAG: mitofilin family membrane protein [Xanthobacteraceae bacterium]
MTSEPDSKPGRRPPTIELKATEVEQPAATAPSGETAAAATPPPDSPSSASPSPRSNAGSARGLKSYAVGAILGAVAIAVIAAVLWFTGVIPSRQVAAPLLPAVPETSAAMHPASTNEAAISARLDRLKRAIQLQRTPPAQNNGAAAAEAQSKVPSDSVAALTRRLNDIAAASQSATKTADAAKAAAEAAKTASANASQSATQAANDAVSKAASEAASQAASQVANQVASQTAGQKSDLDALANRVAAVESAVKALSENAAHPAEGANDQAARLTIAAEELRAAVERGAPYRAELAAVQALGVTQDATAPLEPFAAAGVPTPAALAHQLAALTPELRRASEPSSGGSTFLERLEAHAQHLVSITPVDAPAGNEPSAVMARIEADAERADIAAALTDIAALPETAKPRAADWARKAKAREAAIAASRQIAAAALANLSKPASQ